MKRNRPHSQMSVFFENLAKISFTTRDYVTSTLHKLVFLDHHYLCHLGLLSIECNLMIPDGPTHGNVASTVHKTLPMGWGGGRWVCDHFGTFYCVSSNFINRNVKNIDLVSLIQSSKQFGSQPHFGTPKMIGIHYLHSKDTCCWYFSHFSFCFVFRL